MTPTSDQNGAPSLTDVERSARVSKLKSDLWTAIWEASNLMPLREIEAFCEQVLFEIESDAA